MKISWQAPTTKICARCCREERESTGKPIPGPKGLNMKEQADWPMSIDWEVDENTWMTEERIENMAKLSVCLLFNHRLPKWIWKTLWQNMPWEAGVATDKYIKEHSVILEEKGWVEANEYIKELRKTIKQTEHELAKPM